MLITSDDTARPLRPGETFIRNSLLLLFSFYFCRTRLFTKRFRIEKKSMRSNDRLIRSKQYSSRALAVRARRRPC